jgi:uncharacterized membrane protein
MLQTMFPFDIFGFISGIFILIFVIVIIVFIIIIIVVYKLLHSNVDHENQIRYKLPELRTEDVGTTFIKIDKENLTKEKISSKCKYCGEKIEENIAYCPFCGSNLSK